MVISLLMLPCPVLLFGLGVDELGDAEQLLCAAGQCGKPQSDSAYVKLPLLSMKNTKSCKVVFQSGTFWLLPCSTTGHLLPCTGVNCLILK